MKVSRSYQETPGVRKHIPRNRKQLLLIVQVLEAQHKALMLVASAVPLDIDGLNDDCRSLLSELVEVSDGKA